MQKKMVQGADTDDMHKNVTSTSKAKSGQDSKILTGGMTKGGHAGCGQNGYENATSSGKTFSSGRSSPLVR